MRIEPAPAGGALCAARHAAVCWLLLLMGLATFVPCILLPEWRTFRSLNDHADRQRRRVDAMEDFVEMERRRWLAMQSDPLVLERMAKRELRFTRPGEHVVFLRSRTPAPVLPREPFRLVSGRVGPWPPNEAGGAVHMVTVEAAEMLPQTVRRPTETQEARPAHFARWARYVPEFDFDAVFCDERTRSVLIVMSLALIVVALWLFDAPHRSERAPGPGTHVSG